MVKHIEFFKQRERYQADTALLSNYASEGFKIFYYEGSFQTIWMNNLINDKKAETIL